MKTSTMKDKLFKIFSIIFWIIIWEIGFLLIDRELYLPSPLSTLTTLLTLIKVKTFWYTVFMTISRVIIGFIISCILGTLIGIICGLNKYFYNLFNPLIITIKSTPVMSFIIIALIWFKSSNVPIFICFLMCFPIIWTSVVKGIHNVDNKLIEMARLYEVKKLDVLRGIYIPSIIPYVTTGMITALGLGWKVTVASEVLSSPKFSIGSKLYDAKVYLESEQLFAWTIVVIIFSMIFEYAFNYLIMKTFEIQRIKNR